MAKAKVKPKVVEKVENITCTCCGKSKKELEFYMSYSELYKSIGRLPICKICIESLYNDKLNKYNDVQKAIRELCNMFDAYFEEKIFEAANQESKTKDNNTMRVYMTKINSLMQYKGLTFDYSNVNINKENILTTQTSINQEDIKMTKSDKEIKDDVIRLLCYDPFIGYPEFDQKFLYSELSNYLDEDMLEDQYKLSQILQIVINNNQVRQVDYVISKYTSNPDSLVANQKDLKELSEIKSRIAAISNNIAKENAISVKNRNDKKAGRSTLGYMMKELRELGFENAEQDYYDMKKSYGMKIAADISNKSILDQLKFDDNDLDNMLKEQRELIQELQDKVDELEEKLRTSYEEINKLKIN